MNNVHEKVYRKASSSLKKIAKVPCNYNLILSYKVDIKIIQIYYF